MSHLQSGAKVGQGQSSHLHLDMFNSWLYFSDGC